MQANPENSPVSDGDLDLLRGAEAIAEHLRGLGLADTSVDEVYYLARSGKLSIGRFGKQLIASKRRIARDLQRAAKALATT